MNSDLIGDRYFRKFNSESWLVFFGIHCGYHIVDSPLQETEAQIEVNNINKEVTKAAEAATARLFNMSSDAASSSVWPLHTKRIVPTYSSSTRTRSASKPKAERAKEQKDLTDTKKPSIGERERLHDCRHCGGVHWDFDCPTRKPAVKAEGTEESLSNLTRH
ncbi:hypothetical protein TSTA_012020 [Talaromyces stipitatus ATCC 10500]|uniref:Uncharacterized protein n=1 Tax=Talaromyces stipitatus (strain ATCC 10500 / CBS 375.48 / QM 6759 / NRRL 1006) TaxID=441959 RepID=B8ME16_TALSN|nr:uncharacterized protein TSTA_012020 [Talaromyces stipitatus ATCC 10500]EED16093.1 hypothetical protein TSTA_012020 [Talaromyces stipitatus ATCC 10500]